jgi:glyoxylase-like metal-dependent hydrolase (beta-lactamase superfamily II)
VPDVPARDEFPPGRVVSLTPRVRRITASNPGAMTGPGTNTYLVGAGADVVVIDPGPDEAAHLDAVAGAGGGRVRTILTTHTHPDHAPGAPGLRERTGAPLVGFEARDGFVPDATLVDGDRVEGDGFTIIAVHTPGHAGNHLCYLLAEEVLLFSGDHVMSGSTVVISPPDGDMSAYLASLERCLAMGLRAIAPGHGRLIDDPDAALRAYLDHRRDRERQILDAVTPGPVTIDEVVAALYPDLIDELIPRAGQSVWAHLIKLAGEGRAFGTGRTGAWQATRE